MIVVEPHWRGAERRRPKNANLRTRVDRLREQHETALAEMRHRFANCFQLLSALIQLRARQAESTEARGHLAWVHDHVISLALLQKQLNSAGDDTAFGFFLAEQAVLWRSLCAEQGVKIVIDVEDMELTADKAMPLALIVHELVTNCLEHAFPTGTGGVIRIELKASESGRADLIVADDGAGLPQGLDRSKSLGLRLVERLAAQAGGTFSIESDNGTTARVRFSPT